MVFEEYNSSPDWTGIFMGPDIASCNERALVLTSLDIPHRIAVDPYGRYGIEVPASVAEKAKYEIWQYENENVPQQAQATIQPDYETAVPGVIYFIIVVVAVGWMSARGYFGFDWLGAGRVDGELIRDGEWWRVFTALTLHGSIKHILGNLVFGFAFGMMAGAVAGPGVAWLAILLGGALGNTLNVLFLDAAHRSIGASTSVFAALGLVSGFMWRGRFMKQDSWAWRLGPIVGGLALLAYTGTGDENTDIGAHLMGFASGFLGGMFIVRFGDLRQRGRLQAICGFAAIALVGYAWLFAFSRWPS